MPDLDLSKAIEAIKQAADTFTGLDEAECKILATAALPHILDALAEQANSERAWQAKNYLRAKAVEVRQ